MICSNCSSPTILTNFGYPMTVLLNRSAKFIHICGTCRRSYMDDSVKNAPGWVSQDIDEESRPTSSWYGIFGGRSPLRTFKLVDKA
jgi:hypothetical protein